LVTNAMQDMTLLDLRRGLEENALAPQLLPPLNTFVECYWKWLDATLEQGYFSALTTHEPPLQTAYKDLCSVLLDTGLTGAADLLRRVYKAFLLIDGTIQPADPYLPYCAVWGLSPSVLELSQAQTRYLADYFHEALEELAERGPQHGKRVFQRLLSLARMQRPVTVLVKNSAGSLTTRTRGQALLHCVGEIAAGRYGAARGGDVRRRRRVGSGPILGGDTCGTAPCRPDGAGGFSACRCRLSRRIDTGFDRTSDPGL